MSNTTKRRDLINISGSNYQLANQFLLDVRETPILDSKKQKEIITDVDAVSYNYQTSNFIFIEDKAFLQTPSKSQTIIIRSLNNATYSSSCYNGYFLLQHENKGLYDGYNRLSYYKDDEWNTITSASVDTLTGDDVCNFIHNVKLTGTTQFK